MKALLFFNVLLTFAWITPVFAVELGEGPLTLARVMELAASMGPEVRISATHVAEAEAKLAGAKVRTIENPQLELAAGPRSGDETSIDTDLALEIPIELWGRRDKRISAAEALLQREKHTAEDVRRQSISSAVGAYCQVLLTQKRVELARERKVLAEEILRIATERHQAGDVPRFEVNMARTEVARAESTVSVELGHFALAQGALAQSLGLASGANLKIEGDIKESLLLAALSAESPPQERFDLRAALAEVEVSAANVALAKAEQRPDVALRLSFGQEGEENIAMAGVSIGLPFLNPRQGAVQEAEAKNKRANIAAENRRAAIANEIESARLAYKSAVESVRRLETDALPLQADNQLMAAESYRAGKINLATVLQVRREVIETQREYLERLAEASQSSINLASAIGIFSHD